MYVAHMLDDVPSCIRLGPRWATKVQRNVFPTFAEQSCHCRRHADQAADMGHSRPGEVPKRDARLLPRRTR